MIEEVIEGFLSGVFLTNCLSVNQSLNRRLRPEIQQQKLVAVVATMLMVAMRSGSEVLASQPKECSTSWLALWNLKTARDTK